MQQDIFLVRFSARYFFTGRLDGQPQGVMIPSMAKFLTYDCAIRVIAALRSFGYGDAIVCNTRGQIVMPEDLCIQDDPCQEEFQTVWGSEHAAERPSALQEASARQ
jgi:hypothetical protein